MPSTLVQTICRYVRGKTVVLTLLIIIAVGGLEGGHKVAHAQDSPEHTVHVVAPGDSWTALARQYGIQEETLWRLNRLLNVQRKPTIGRQVLVPIAQLAVDAQGMMVHAGGFGLLDASARHGLNPWKVAIQNGVNSPRSPNFNRPIFASAAGNVPRDLPHGFRSLEMSPSPVQPGLALGFVAELDKGTVTEARLGEVPLTIVLIEDRVIGITGTGAFFQPGAHELEIETGQGQSWSQPLMVEPGDWTYEQITLTGTAAAIDQDSIAEEWERLSEIWSVISPEIQWSESFRLPIQEFLEFSSPYGAHRSYNGGPYRSYHEGVDFSAYGGTPVLAPASGTVVVAESLYVRGGVVLIDHGYGVFSGLYHQSEILVQPGERVDAGQILGRVGSTGLSTGNHLHWDLIVGGSQVDGRSWIDLNLGCWILRGLDLLCEDQPAP